jgi:hypothetical protein
MINSILPKNLETRRYFIQVASKYGTVIVLLLYFILLFSQNVKDDDSFSNNKIAFYVIAVVTPLVLFSYIVLSNVEDKKYLGLVVLMILTILLTLLGSAVPSFGKSANNFIEYLTEQTELPPMSPIASFLILFTSKLLLICIIVVALSILFNVFLNESSKNSGLLGIISYSIFLIPCYVSDYLKYLFKELTTTPKVVYALLFIEIILISLYFVIPLLLRKYQVKNSNQIVTSPAYFYFENIIANSKQLYPQKTVSFPYDGALATNQAHNYCLSMWLYTNAPSYGKDQEQMMFRYGSVYNPNVGCPYISCKGNGKWKIVVSNAYTEPLTMQNLDWERYYADHTDVANSNIYGYNVKNGAWNHYDKDGRDESREVHKKITKGTFDYERYFKINQVILKIREYNEISDDSITTTKTDVYNYYKSLNPDSTVKKIDFNDKTYLEELGQAYLRENGIDESLEGAWKHYLEKGVQLLHDSSKTTLDRQHIRNREFSCNIDDKTVEYKVPLQRWNNLVFNYHDNMVDIFLNGELASTISLAENCIPYYGDEMNMTIGNDKNTLHGAICNVHYSQNMMSSSKIAQNYNLLKLRNPPI